MLQEGYLHRSFQMHSLQFETVPLLENQCNPPGSGRPGIVGGVVLSFPIINHYLSDDTMMEIYQEKNKFGSQVVLPYFKLGNETDYSSLH